nr:hypothetical protein [Paraburkholderia caledonica]
MIRRKTDDAAWMHWRAAAHLQAYANQCTDFDVHVGERQRCLRFGMRIRYGCWLCCHVRQVAAVRLEVLEEKGFFVDSCENCAACKKQRAVCIDDWPFERCAYGYRVGAEDRRRRCWRGIRDLLVG